LCYKLNPMYLFGCVWRGTIYVTKLFIIYTMYMTIIHYLSETIQPLKHLKADRIIVSLKWLKYHTLFFILLDFGPPGSDFIWRISHGSFASAHSLPGIIVAPVGLDDGSQRSPELDVEVVLDFAKM
jgi:hypothetical protein